MVLVVKSEEVKGIEVPPPYRRTIKILVSPEIQNVQSIAIGMVSLPPGSEGDLHVHNESDEYWIVVDGRGVLKIGNERIDLSIGTITLAPKGVEHQIFSNPDTPLAAYFLYMPSGPETVFLSSAKGNSMLVQD